MQRASCDRAKVGDLQALSAQEMNQRNERQTAEERRRIFLRKKVKGFEGREESQVDFFSSTALNSLSVEAGGKGGHKKQ